MRDTVRDAVRPPDAEGGEAVRVTELQVGEGWDLVDVKETDPVSEQL